MIQLGTLLAITGPMSQFTSTHFAWFLCGAALTATTAAAAQAPTAPATDGWTEPPAPAAPPTADLGDAPSARAPDAPADAPADPATAADAAPAEGDVAATESAPAASPPPTVAPAPAPVPIAPAPEAPIADGHQPPPAPDASDAEGAGGAGRRYSNERSANVWGDEADRFEYQPTPASPDNTFGFGLLGMGMDASPDSDAEPTTRFIAGGFLGRLRASAFLGSSYHDKDDTAHLQYGLALGITNGSHFRMSPSMLVVYDQDRNSTGVFGYLPFEWVGDTIVGGVHIGFGRWSGLSERYRYYYSDSTGSSDGTEGRKNYGSDPAFTLMGVVGARFGDEVAPLADPRTSLPEKEMFFDWLLAPVTIMDGKNVAAMSSGVQFGGFIGPIRLAAQAMLPIANSHDHLSVMDSLVFGGSAGFALRSTHFAFSPGLKVLHFGGTTEYRETEVFLAFPFEWTLTNGYRLGFSYDTFSVTQKAINVQLQFGTAF